MTKILPFQGIFYNSQKIDDFAKVVSPPYDVISPEEQKELYRRHPLNIVRIDYGKVFFKDSQRDNRYTRARDLFQKWLREKILIQDKASCFYLLSQEFTYRGNKFVRWGIIGRARLYEKRRVFLHEKTSLLPKEDRFKLLKAVRANLNPIFTLFEDKNRFIYNLSNFYLPKQPFIQFNFSQVKHCLWRIDRPDLITNIQREMENKNIFIADGHHRYEVSLLYQRYRRKANPHHTGKEDYNYVMAYLTPMEDKALKILSIHRLIKELPPAFWDKLNLYFEILPCGKDYLLNGLDKTESNAYLLGIYLGKGKYFLLRLRSNLDPEKLIFQNKPAVWKKLDVSLFQAIILEKVFSLNNSNFELISYTPNLEEAIQRVNNHEFKIAFFLRPTSVCAVKEIALLRERMPHKSTYFYPKLPSGLIINPV
ncbi:MAG: DUF1015 domain-containing protein [Candidatus Omnitrophica bacterium]|nr:DUF1015 domain-containing protein [Candidatus Omnitrophota bacterium]MCM8792886.1 DUF1015 domain-containing protein [Candidatus Omnitrophota bacterium]